MKKIVFFLVGIIISFFAVSDVFAAENKVTLYLFYGDGCPHCAHEKEFLNDIKDDYNNLEIVQYEVWYDEDNQDFLEKVKEELEIDKNGVPVTIIGETVIMGYSDSMQGKIKRAIKFYTENEYKDVVSQIKNGTYVKELDDVDEFLESEKKSDDETTVDVPIVGDINLKGVSITTAAFILGLIDGFNPCAMWVLLFLISMLLGMKNKKRMWIIGLTFLFTSAFVYMMIMLSWLNVVVGVSTSILMRNIIALVAIVGGGINLYNFFKHQDSGCSVVDEKKRKKVFSRIKKFTKEKSLLLALGGTILLALSVNVIELACSAGLPLVYTQLLAINNITGVSAFLYVLLYMVFFLFDDFCVFFVAMHTMEVTGISTKYSKYSHLIGGMLMIIIGILLIFRPEWLMFQFS